MNNRVVIVGKTGHRNNARMNHQVATEETLEVVTGITNSQAGRRNLRVTFQRHVVVEVEDLQGLLAEIVAILPVEVAAQEEGDNIIFIKTYFAEAVSNMMQPLFIWVPAENR